jgi:hypothetical protein
VVQGLSTEPANRLMFSNEEGEEQSVAQYFEVRRGPGAWGCGGGGGADDMGEEDEEGG